MRLCLVDCVFCDPAHPNQRQPQVAHLDQHAVQRGLVDDRPSERRGAVRLVGDRQPIEPLRPVRVEVPWMLIS